MITFQQARDLFANRSELIKLVEREGGEKNEGGHVEKQDALFILIEAIVSLNVERKDDPTKIIDEDDIYQALAADWKVPFVKIDPLKLDLNVVTTTVPITFAKKHLVLPVEIRQGRIVVATPNPFNLEVFEDITRACQMQVDAVVSPRSDIVKLIGEFFGFKRSIAAAEHPVFRSQRGSGKPRALYQSSVRR